MYFVKGIIATTAPTPGPEDDDAPPDPGLPAE